jgi:hypothetical protein
LQGLNIFLQKQKRGDGRGQTGLDLAETATASRLLHAVDVYTGREMGQGPVGAGSDSGIGNKKFGLISQKWELNPGSARLGTRNKPDELKHLLLDQMGCAAF